MNRLQKNKKFSKKKILLEYSFVVSVAFNSFVHADTKIWKFEGRKKNFLETIFQQITVNKFLSLTIPNIKSP